MEKNTRLLNEQFEKIEEELEQKELNSQEKINEDENKTGITESEEYDKFKRDHIEKLRNFRKLLIEYISAQNWKKIEHCEREIAKLQEEGNQKAKEHFESQGNLFRNIQF